MYKLLCVTLGFGGALIAQSWNHDPASPLGPNSWGYLGGYNSYATCGTDKQAVGAKQTPIDIVVKNATAAELPHLEFHYAPTHLVVKNLSHVVEVENEAEESALILGPSPVDRYRLVQFHFHTPSEHTINGKGSAMELHLVHQNVLGELAVVGVMVNEDNGRANPLLEKIFANAPYLTFFSFANSSSPDLGEFHPTELLPESRSYYTYTGSLTTPPCSEGVHWFVMTEPVFVSAASVAKYQSILTANSRYSYNNRPVQPLNGRTVLVTK